LRDVWLDADVDAREPTLDVLAGLSLEVAGKVKGTAQAKLERSCPTCKGSMMSRDFPVIAR